jgi:secreted Zn-dependent insulinase-like peptidase
VLLTASSWGADQVRSALASVTLDDLRLFSRSIFRDAALECLVTGNVESADAWKVSARAPLALPEGASLTQRAQLVQRFRDSVELKSIGMDSRRANFLNDRVIELDGSYKFVARPSTANDPVRHSCSHATPNAWGL